MAQRKCLVTHVAKHVPHYRQIFHKHGELLREAGRSRHVPMVICRAEVFYDFQHQEIEQRLGARVYNPYTHGEHAASILACADGCLQGTNDKGADDTQHMISRLRQPIGKERRIDRRFCEMKDLEGNPIGKFRYADNQLFARTELIQTPEDSRNGIIPTKLKA